MKVRRLISSGSWMVRQLCTTATAMEAMAVAPKRDRLYSRLSELRVKGGTVAQTLNDYVMEPKHLSKDELTRCIKDLRKYGRYQHALDIIDWMERRNLNLSWKDYVMRIDLLAKSKGIDAAENYFSGLHPDAKNQFTYGALLNCYCYELKTEKALAQFEEMDKLQYVNNCLPFNNLMSMYMKLGQYDKVHALVDEMKKRNISPVAYTYTVWMQSYGCLNDIEGVERVLEEMAKDSEVNSNWTTYSNLAAIYIKAGQYEKAELSLKKLEKCPKPLEREAYHFLISLYAGTSNLAEVKRVWDALKGAFSSVTNMSYLIMLRTLAKLNDLDGLKECFKEWESICSNYDPRLAVTVVHAYLMQDMIEEAKWVFEKALKRSNGHFFKLRETFMVYFLKKQQLNLALEHMEGAVSEVKDNNWQPAPETLTAFFDYFTKEKDADGAEGFCRVLKNLNCLNSDTYCLLLKTYIAADKVVPNIYQRLEEDDIELSKELQELIKVCPT
ncbi:hypothetical protein SLA2020_166400 [Shorea laevis]